MIRTIKAIIQPDGTVQLLEPIRLESPRQAIPTILEDDDSPSIDALLSEAALAVDWSRPEEDAAWVHLERDHRRSR